MKAIIVARVSTEEQKEAGNSLPAQISRMESYCERHNYLIVKAFSIDESAYKTKRDEFDKLLEVVQETARPEKISVCFDKVDRLSRSIFDKRVGTLYEMAVADQIELHFVSDGQVVNNQMSAVEKFQFGMSLGLAKYYSDAISDSVKRVFEQKRRRGEWTGKPRIGYINSTDANGKNTIVIDQDRSHIVIKLFEMYASGNHSLETIKDNAADMGLRSLDGNVLSRSSIENILKDSFYCGIAISRKYGAFPHKYPRLISKELFDKCQEIRESKRRKPQKCASRDFIFKGLLTCSRCGCTMSPERKTKMSGKTFIYYSCTNAKRICHREYVPEKAILEPIYRVLERFESIKEETQDWLVEELRKNNESEVAFHKAQINRIRNEYEQLKLKDDRLLEAYLEESITKDVYDKKHQDIHDRLQMLNIELEEHTKADYDYQTTVATVISVARRARAIFESSELAEKRAFINYLVQNPTVTNKTLNFTLRSPFNFVFELANRPIKQLVLAGNKDEYTGT